MRPNCECCGTALAVDAGAFICSLECTFCPAGANGVLDQTCPNCGGELTRRPRRAAKLAARFPASTKRVDKPDGCAGAP